MMILSIACVVNMDTVWNSRVRIEDKVMNFITLNRFVKYNAQLSGMKSKVFIDNNKIKVVLENIDGITNSIVSLQSQIDEVNDSVEFNSEETNIVTYLPDGSLENGGSVNLKIEEESALISINEWNKVDVVYTNKQDEFINSF